jgi:pyruvate,orthophosphate dikinase
MIPLVFSEHEVDYIIAIINRVRREMSRLEGIHEGSLSIQIGSMIETPRACLRADRIANIDEVEFMSFGSNDLTQMMLGLSRDDTHQFMVSRRMISISQVALTSMNHCSPSI